jgi:hypothetical protein
MSNNRSNDNKSKYEIKVLGMIDQTWSDWFDGFSILILDQSTLLHGEVIDQAALLGILNKIHGLGLTLISVKRINRSTTDVS